MLENLSKHIQSASGVATVIISVAFMLLFGFLLTRITKRLKLPNVTAYIVAGILIGPYCLNLVPKNVIDGMSFLADIALAFIAFSTGEYFKLDTLKKNGLKVVIITVAEALMASLLVFVTSYCILGVNLAFSLVLAALASATAPASTVMTIRQTGAKGDFVNTLLQVVALDDIVALVAYGLCISLAVSSVSGEAFHMMSVIKPLAVNLGVLVLGCVFGFIMKLSLYKHSTDNRLIVSIALLFGFCGICALFDVSPLLGCMSMGTVYINVTNDDKLFKQLNYFSPPLLLLFFVRSGLSFDLGALFNPSDAVGTVPLAVIGVTYFLTRIVGKYAGAFLGCAAVKKSKEVRNYLGLALIPQAGVAIGLAALGARTLGGEHGAALETVILASSVLYELIGPPCAKLSLYLSKSYSTKLEDIVPLEEETDENGVPKTQLELLIERIQKIQEELPPHTDSEEEKAFTNAAEEQYNAAFPHRKRQAGRW